MNNRQELLNAHQHKLHYLAQYLAAFNAAYQPPAKDHSHQSLEWNIENSALQTHQIKGVHFELEYPGLMIYLYHNEHRHAFDPLGAAHGDLESWMRESLSARGMDAGKYTLDMGFTPSSPKDLFISLDGEDEKILLQLTEERNIAQRALEMISDTARMEASAIRVWPHHFDTAIRLYPQQGNAEKGIGLGYSPASKDISDVPYFYAYAWSENEIDYSKLPALEAGTWHLEQWQGAKIPVDQALDLKVITNFYREFIEIIENSI